MKYLPGASYSQRKAAFITHECTERQLTLDIANGLVPEKHCVFMLPGQTLSRTSMKILAVLKKRGFEVKELGS